MRIKNEKDNFSLSVLEILATDPDNLEDVKKQLIRSLVRRKSKQRLCIPENLYTPILVHFDTLLRELRLEDAKPILERLNVFEKVYEDEIYTFLIEHFHQLHNNETMWKILIILNNEGM